MKKAIKVIVGVIIGIVVAVAGLCAVFAFIDDDESNYYAD